MDNVKTDELWKFIEGYPNYMVSSHGRVMNAKRKRILANIFNPKGYASVCLGRNKPFRVNRLVAQAFVPNPENKSQVNHIDEVKENNHASNLEWATSLENIQHSMKNVYTVTDPQGKQHVVRHLTEFCKEHQLNTGNMCQASLGKMPPRLGWSIQRGATC
jgi:hypothetical protein